ncbi:MAG TPA: 50S ribosomal protein L25 [Candidatus Baltobacteraceae bacterium]|nr:50S ribosomal protein L25 [Candidatus Baltobacteraceae bacterium]
MATVDLKGELRSVVGKEGAKRLRRQQRVPAVVYGRERGPVSVTINPTELLKVLESGENVLINLSLGGDGGQTSLVILKELQRDPAKGRVLHADFQEVSVDRKIRVEVPLVMTGTPVGVKDKGGILEHTLRQLLVECLPLSIPERITVDVSGLDIGDALHVSDITVAEGIRILDEGARVMVSVIAPAAEEVAAPTEEEKPVEPEVVGKKEKEEAEAADTKDTKAKGPEAAKAK